MCNFQLRLSGSYERPSGEQKCSNGTQENGGKAPLAIDQNRSSLDSQDGGRDMQERGEIEILHTNDDDDDENDVNLRQKCT